MRLALWRAFEHDAFGVAKGAAYSSILTLFPALMLTASIVAATSHGPQYINEISGAAHRVLPPGTAAAVQTYFESTKERPIGVLIAASLITLWTASGVVVSWMDGFRRAYSLPKVWGVVKERFIAFGLVIIAGMPLTFATVLVAFGNQIEERLRTLVGHHFGLYVIFAWAVLRWIIAIATSVAVMQLIYHNAVPRTLRWHTVLPGAALATAVWFPATMGFGWYVRHFAEYSIYYGSLATAIVLLVWLFIMSVIVLVGAEFNALLYPRGTSRSGETTLAL